MGTDAKPIFLIAGGPSSAARSGPDPFLQRALSLTAKDFPSVAYIGAASGDNALFRRMIQGWLLKAGAAEVKSVQLCGARANPQKARRIIESCDIVFLSGGDVELGMRILLEHQMVDFLRNQHMEGKPFFGISAGSIMLAKQWVRWRDPEVESSAGLFPCLGVAPVYCDTHGEEDDWEELKALTRLIPDGSLSYGIASGTALIAYPNGRVRVLGGEVHAFAHKGAAVEQIKSLFPDSK